VTQWQDLEHELERIGREVEATYTGGLTVNNRPMTNVEMMADQWQGRRLAQERMQRDGCCEGQPDDDGFCFDVGGMCPRCRGHEERMTESLIDGGQGESQNERGPRGVVTAGASDHRQP
jgi:hypothetical protein